MALYTANTFGENRFKQTQMMKSRPTGWLIMDSKNNKMFPQDIFTIDTMQFNTEKLAKDFHQNYGGNSRDLFLPWHYTMDLVNNKPFVIQTRPIMYKSGIPGYQNYMVIMIIGDSNEDLYQGQFYKQIAHMIMNPLKFLPSVRMPNSKESIEFWTGKGFQQDLLLNELI